MTPTVVLTLVAGWAAVAGPVALMWGRGRCRHPQPRPAGAGLAVPGRDEPPAGVRHILVVVRHEHVVTVRHDLAAGSPPLEAARRPVVVDGEVLPPGGRGWAR